MRKLIFVAWFAVAVGFWTGTVADAQDTLKFPTGVYEVRGTNPDNDEVYKAVLEVRILEVKENDIPLVVDTPSYMMRWTTGKNAASGEWNEAYGYGYIAGERLVVVIQDAQSGIFVLADYIRSQTSKDTWVGSWSIVMAGVFGTETLTLSEKSAEYLKELLPVAASRSL